MDIRKIKARVVGQREAHPAAEIKGRLTGSLPEIKAGGLVFRHAVVQDVSFANLTIERYESFSSEFINCDFTKARLLTGCLGYADQSVYRGCRFIRTKMRNVQPGNARFEQCLFEYADLKHWQANLSEFVDCKFVGRVESVMFFGRPEGPGAKETRRRSNAFEGNDFMAADLIDTAFKMNIDLDKNTFPADDDYVRLENSGQRIQGALAALGSWSDSELKRKVNGGLQAYKILSEDQPTLLTRRSEFESVIGKEANDAMWALLEST